MGTKFTKLVTVNAPEKDVLFDGCDFTEEGRIVIEAANSVTIKNSRFFGLTGTDAPITINSDAYVSISHSFFDDGDYTELVKGLNKNSNSFVENYVKAAASIVLDELSTGDIGDVIKINGNVFEKSAPAVVVSPVGSPYATIEVKNNRVRAYTGEYEGVVAIQPKGTETVSMNDLFVDLTGKYYLYAGENDTQFSQKENLPNVIADGKEVAIRELVLAGDTRIDLQFDWQTGNGIYETLADAIENLGPDAVITLVDDNSVEDYIMVDSDLVIDLNGKTVTFTLPQARSLTNYAKLTIKNGTIVNSNTASYGFIQNRGTLTLENVTVKEYGADGGAAIQNMSGSTLTITDSTLNAFGDAANQLVRNHNNETDVTTTIKNSTFKSESVREYPIVIRGGKTDISDATVTGKHGAIGIEAGYLVVNDVTATGENYYGLYVSNTFNGGTTVVVNGGTYTGNSTDLYATAPDGDNNGSKQNGNVKVTVNGGTFTHAATIGKTENSKGYEWTLNIKGGTYGSDPSEYVDLEKYSVTQDGDKFVVKEIPMIAEINGKLFATVNAAIESIETLTDEPVTIKITQDVEDGIGIGIADKKPKNIIVDFQGHTYIAASKGVGSTGFDTQVLHLAANSTVVLKNGSIIVKEGHKSFNMFMQNYANLTIENMVLDSRAISASKYRANQYAESSPYYPWNGLRIPLVNWNSGTSVIKGKTQILSADDATHYVHKGATGNYPQGANLTIEDCELIMGNLFQIVNGTYNGPGVFEIIGGTFQHNPEEYVAKGYTAQQDAESNLWVVRAMTEEELAAQAAKEAEEAAAAEDTTTAEE